MPPYSAHQIQSSRAAPSSMRKKRFLLDGPYSKDLPRPRRRMHIGRNPHFVFFAHSHAAPRRTAHLADIDIVETKE
ncbi:uncharacterized protein CCOS01_13257 [Colletotrichum costaricense]|nr:uncharacterized protein CCOS01_13257 [Colletotrichum costaricense]KAK1515064.1 hypothetical protein CCOS01_13257 [Colletotrichum costaricense]